MISLQKISSTGTTCMENCEWIVSCGNTIGIASHFSKKVFPIQGLCSNQELKILATKLNYNYQNNNL